MVLTHCPETSVTTDLLCVTSQKSDDLIYTKTEAWNHALRYAISTVDLQDALKMELVNDLLFAYFTADRAA
jgi:hypothetical protein